MLSPARLAANRRNARKSTGPKTAEGKAQSRRNAVKHGLRSEQEILPPEDQALFDQRLEDWLADAPPRDHAEEYLIRAAVLATVKLDRCARADIAFATRMRRGVLSDWQKRQDAEVADAGARLGEDPAGAVAQLQEFTSGCDWLIAQWTSLQEPLESPGYWNPDQAAQALRLLGHFPDYANCLDPCVLGTSLAYLAAMPEVDPDEVDRLFGESTVQLDPAERQRVIDTRLPAADAARLALRNIVQGELERLGKLRQQLWFEQDGPDLAEEIDLAVVDTSEAGALVHRYASASHHQLMRALHELLMRQKSASALSGSPIGAERVDRSPRVHGQESTPVAVASAERFLPTVTEPEVIVPPVDPPAETAAPNEPTETPAEARTEGPIGASTNQSSPAETGQSSAAPNEPMSGVAPPPERPATERSATSSHRPLTERELFDLQRRLGGYV